MGLGSRVQQPIVVTAKESMPYYSDGWGLCTTLKWFVAKHRAVRARLQRLRDSVSGRGMLGCNRGQCNLIKAK